MKSDETGFVRDAQQLHEREAALEPSLAAIHPDLSVDDVEASTTFGPRLRL